jgi:hypothetical protein
MADTESLTDLPIRQTLLMQGEHLPDQVIQRATVVRHGWQSLVQTPRDRVRFVSLGGFRSRAHQNVRPMNVVAETEMSDPTGDGQRE